MHRKYEGHWTKGAAKFPRASGKSYERPLSGGHETDQAANNTVEREG